MKSVMRDIIAIMDEKMVQRGMEGMRDPGKLLCRGNIRAEHSRKRV